jgi:hypothetical protein
MRNKGRRRSQQAVRASELAEMGVCERRMRFKADLGVRRSKSQQQAAPRGVRMHAAFRRDGVGVQGEPVVREQPKRFIGTAICWLPRVGGWVDAGVRAMRRLQTWLAICCMRVW